MIQRLVIENLVLVQKAEIRFGPGLNILTGETGAGKSAVLAAIRLLLGMRADSELIRRGTDRAVVEAETDKYILRREIYASGKSRAFVDDAQVSLQELKELLGHSIELVDQSSSHTLAEPSEQLRLLDTFGSVNTEPMQQAIAAQKKAQAHLDELLHLQTTGNLVALQEDLARITETKWAAGEEEHLSQEHHLLTHAQELLEKIGAVTEFLTESSEPTVSTLKRFSHQLETLLKPSADALRNTALELEEISRTLIHFTDRLEANPHKLASIEQRLAQIESLKRRFGPTHADVEQRRTNLTTKIDQLTNLDMDTARTHLATLTKHTQTLAAQITEARKKTIPLFEQAILHELHQLNLPHAKLSISLEPNSVQFLFSANPGNEPLPLDQCASGGELSRLLFAIKVALADKEHSACLIFDEIDSNVGGKTAALLGEKLRYLAQKRQILCVTHFVQVAKCATDHFLVSKQTDGTNTATHITKLSHSAREQEFSRMLGTNLH